MSILYKLPRLRYSVIAIEKQREGGRSSAVECLLGMQETLGSISSTQVGKREINKVVNRQESTLPAPETDERHLSLWHWVGVNH